MSRNGKMEGEPLAGVLPILSDGLGVYCGVADGARGCYVGGAVCGALVAFGMALAVPWLSWLYIVRGLQVLSRTGSAPPPSAAPAGGPEASFTSSGHAGCRAGGTWAADLRAGQEREGRAGAGLRGGRPVAAAWPRCQHYRARSSATTGRSDEPPPRKTRKQNPRARGRVQPSPARTRTHVIEMYTRTRTTHRHTPPGFSRPGPPPQ